MNKNGAKTKEFIKKLQASKGCCPKLRGESLEKCLEKIGDCEMLAGSSKAKAKH